MMVLRISIPTRLGAKGLGFPGYAVDVESENDLNPFLLVKIHFIPPKQMLYWMDLLGTQPLTGDDYDALNPTNEYSVKIHCVHYLGLLFIASEDYPLHIFTETPY